VANLITIKRVISIALLGFFLLSVFGCASSGKWEDDPQNWKREWGYSKPDSVVMTHSWYWRSPHWTREEAFFFQFQWHEVLFDQFVKNNKLTLGELSPGSKPDYCFEKPSWFVPKELSAYEIWKTHTEDDVVLFRDIATKELFLYGCQI